MKHFHNFIGLTGFPCLPHIHIWLFLCRNIPNLFFNSFSITGITKLWHCHLKHGLIKLYCSSSFPLILLGDTDACFVSSIYLRLGTSVSVSPQSEPGQDQPKRTIPRARCAWSERDISNLWFHLTLTPPEKWRSFNKQRRWFVDSLDLLAILIRSK